MIERTLTPSQLPQLAAALFANHHVVALTVATDDWAWACQAAWASARAAAASGRPVLLVDLSSEGPGLDTRTTGATTRGVMDVFEDGGALEEVAREQAPGLHYIGRGAAGEPGPTLWASDRWQRLARGFSSQDALLLLFAPPAALSLLAIEGLSILLIAPAGFDAATASGEIVRSRLESGAGAVGVIARSLVPPRPSGPRPAPSRARAITGAGGLGVALVIALVVAWARESGAERRAESRLERPMVLPGPAVLPADSLYYSVQVAAYRALSEALARASAIEEVGRLAVVTPTRIGTQGTWYRVLVAALPTARAADSLLQALWRDGTVDPPQGTILRTPDTYRLPRASAGDVPGLRSRGVPAYIVVAPDSTEQVFVGAFDLAEQARLTDSILAAANLSGTLVRRTGSSR